ncbi:hypothetical protein J6590_001099 [Homalodisca vitripennis]|nr:hypothetical protein J6590_001099 [Homalodisca vitripennis]
MGFCQAYHLVDRRDVSALPGAVKCLLLAGLQRGGLKVCDTQEARWVRQRRVPHLTQNSLASVGEQMLTFNRYSAVVRYYDYERSGESRRTLDPTAIIWSLYGPGTQETYRTCSAQDTLPIIRTIIALFCRDLRKDLLEDPKNSTPPFTMFPFLVILGIQLWWA